MYRLNDCDRVFLQTALNYTDEQKAIISKITHGEVLIMGQVRSIPLRQGELELYTTPEGISKQLDVFTQPIGLLWYYDAASGDMAKRAVNIDHNIFYAQPHIVERINKWNQEAQNITRQTLDELKNNVE